MQVLPSPSPSPSPSSSSPTARPRPVLSFTPLTPIVSPPSTPPNDLSPPRPLFPPAALAALSALSPSPSLSSSSSTSTADDALSSSGSSSAASFKSVPSSRSLAPHHERSACADQHDPAPAVDAQRGCRDQQVRQERHHRHGGEADALAQGEGAAANRLRHQFREVGVDGHQFDA